MKKVQPTKQEVLQQKAEDFQKDYDKICKKHNLQIVNSPAWMRRDDGTFSLVIQRSIGLLPKN